MSAHRFALLLKLTARSSLPGTPRPQNIHVSHPSSRYRPSSERITDPVLRLPKLLIWTTLTAAPL